MGVPLCFVNWEAILPHAISNSLMLVHLEGGRSRPDVVVLFAIFFIVSCVLVAECRAGHQALFMCVRIGASPFFLRFLFWQTFIWLFFKLRHGFRGCCCNWYSHPKLAEGRTCKCESSSCCFSAANRQKRCYDAFNPHVLTESNDANNLVELFTHDTFFCTFGETSDCAPFFAYVLLFLSWYCPLIFSISRSFLFPYCSSSFVLL